MVYVCIRTTRTVRCRFLVRFLCHEQSRLKWLWFCCSCHSNSGGSALTITQGELVALFTVIKLVPPTPLSFYPGSINPVQEWSNTADLGPLGVRMSVVKPWINLMKMIKYHDDQMCVSLIQSKLQCWSLCLCYDASVGLYRVWTELCRKHIVLHLPCISSVVAYMATSQ